MLSKPSLLPAATTYYLSTLSMELYENRGKQRSCHSFWHSLPERISKGLDRFFYRLGLRIARNPKRWLLGCSVIILACISGLFRFRQEKNPSKLWIPPNSDFVMDTEWLLSHHRDGVRTETFILTGDNILNKESLIKLNEMTKRVKYIQTPENISWSDVCMKVPVISGFAGRSKRHSSNLEDAFFDDDIMSKINSTSFEPAVHADVNLYCSVIESLPMACVKFSILDLWKFDSEKIAEDSMEGIITKINTIKVSPTLGHGFNFSQLLGDVTLDDSGRIIAAGSVKTVFLVHVNYLNVNMDKIGNEAGTADWATEDVQTWELAFLNYVQKLSNELQNEKDANASLALYYEAGRSFGDLSGSSIFQDVDKLCVGIILMFIYVLTILSNHNWVEWKFCLTAAGLSCVGTAFILAVGLCSLLGIPYGPVHTALPFLLLGLGIDDIFVFNASWKKIHTYESHLNKPLTERIGLALGHAGSAITVTSFTDIVAFLIGASTILPSLQSFCIYAAMGVFCTYLLQITIFVSCFTLDVRRIEEKKNGALPCIVHENFTPTLLDPSSAFSWKFINALYSRVILTTPGRIIVMAITIALMSVGVVGSVRLEQWFDPQWLLPKDSYLSQYITVSSHGFPHDGFPAFVVMGDDIDYVSEFSKIISITERLSNASYVQNIEPWPIDFATFVSTYFETDLRTTIISGDDFHSYLSKFLVSRVGGKYQRNLLFNETFTCGENAPRIMLATIEFKFMQFTSPQKWIGAMDDSKRVAREAHIHGYVTVWSRPFATWITDKLIAQELIRNLVLALICVMATTALFIVEMQTCCWILLCVILTLLDVCGFMYFWGLTIDMVSTIALELAVGLCVDYAAHVAHAFLNAESRDNDKHDRNIRVLLAVRHIGAAVAFGAGSMLISISMLAFSTSYVFMAFFQIFFLVIMFGLWHGLILLPVVLSVIGPRSLHVIQSPQPLSEKTAEKATDDED